MPGDHRNCDKKRSHLDKCHWRVASLVERAGESVVLLAEAPSAVRIQSLNKTRNRRRETALFDQILKRHESDSAGVHHWRRRCYSVVGHRRDPRAGH
jgi:hypothetical protein